MVERLARFLDASVVLMSAQGEREIVAGKPPADELLDEVCAEPPGLLELDAAGWHAVATPVVTRADRPARWLVLASPRLGFVDKLAKPAAEATAPLLAAMARLGDVVREQEQAVKAALLKEALEPDEPRDPLPLAARAAAFGIDFSRPARLVVVRRQADLGRARRMLVAELDHAHTSHLVYERGDALVALIQCDDGVLDRAVRAVSEALPTAAIGIGRPVTGIAEAHHSLHDAELAAGGGGITRFEDFDLGRFLVSEVPRERLGPKVDEILAELRANPALYDAVGAYFAHDLDIASTAEALHMHRNSLRYRLARAEHVLGRSFKQPSTIASVYLALVAEAGDGIRP